MSSLHIWECEFGCVSLQKKTSFEVLMFLCLYTHTHSRHTLNQCKCPWRWIHITLNKRSQKWKKAWEKIQKHKKMASRYYADQRMHTKKASSEWVPEMWFSDRFCIKIIITVAVVVVVPVALFLSLTNATVWLSNTHLNEIQINCTIYSYICLFFSLSICLSPMGDDITNYCTFVCIFPSVDKCVYDKHTCFHYVCYCLSSLLSLEKDCHSTFSLNN